MSITGRPHVLDDAKCAEICDLVAAGHSVAAAARFVGCDAKTIRRRASRDEQFGRLLGAAELSAQADPLKMMRRATGTSWRAAAWLLERTDPERYAKKPAAACSPEQLQESFTRLIEAALRNIADEAIRRRVYESLSQVVQEETLRLFLPPAARRGPKQEMTPCVDQQRLNDCLDAITQSNLP